MANNENQDNSKTKTANKKGTQRAHEDRGNDTGMQDRGKMTTGVM